MGKFNSSANGLEGRLKYLMDLRIPGYLNSVPRESVRQLDFIQRDSIAWYGKFLAELDAAIGKRFLPIYRMADGEFIFSVGRYADHLTWRASPKEWISYLVNTVSYGWQRRQQTRLATCWGEFYAEQELAQLKEHYAECLRKVARHGYLALHFTRTTTKFSEQYFRPMCRWFDEAEIAVTKENYLPFYFVYALLCGPDVKRLIANRTILVVTSADDEKKARIARSLVQLGARTVCFKLISPNKAMLNKIDLSKIPEKIDVALVGAGIGSVSILAQLEVLQTVCLDSGVFIEILANPSKRGRIFTVPDSK
jgi:hypothetical protein